MALTLPIMTSGPSGAPATLISPLPLLTNLPRALLYAFSLATLPITRVTGALTSPQTVSSSLVTLFSTKQCSLSHFAGPPFSPCRYPWSRCHPPSTCPSAGPLPAGILRYPSARIRYTSAAVSSTRLYRALGIPYTNVRCPGAHGASCTGAHGTSCTGAPGSFLQQAARRPRLHTACPRTQLATAFPQWGSSSTLWHDSFSTTLRQDWFFTASRGGLHPATCQLSWHGDSREVRIQAASSCSTHRGSVPTSAVLP